MQSHGEQDVQCPVFPVCLVAAHTEQAKVPLATCAVVVACSLLQRHGGDGTGRSTSTRRGGHLTIPLTAPDRSCIPLPVPGLVCVSMIRYTLVAPLHSSSTSWVAVCSLRYAVASALAASAVPSLVLARGHRIEEVPEIPLVVDDGAQTLTKTRKALDLLQRLGAAPGEQSMKSALIPLPVPFANGTLVAVWPGVAPCMTQPATFPGVADCRLHNEPLAHGVSQKISSLSCMPDAPSCCRVNPRSVIFCSFSLICQAKEHCAASASTIMHSAS